MKKIWILSTIAMAMLLTACAAGNGVAENELPQAQVRLGQAENPGNSKGTSGGGSQGNGSAVGYTQSGALSQEEIDGLLYMREEEKLARDVYTALSDMWGLTVFQNIAASEQTHMDSILGLLEKYELEDPAAGKSPGEFVNPDLQALYDDWMARGSQSAAEALKVGALIEEVDILDLREEIPLTDNTDLQQVYESLEQGSCNHLRAFVSVLQNQTGETYQPVQLTQEAYDEIIGTTTENAGQGAGQPGGKGPGGPNNN